MLISQSTRYTGSLRLVSISLPWRVAITAMGSICLLLSCSGSTKSTAKVQASTSSEHRKPAPDFSLKDANGDAVKLSDYRGKIVLLNFWATWCGPCTEEIPWLIEFEQQFKSQGFEVVGVSMDTEGWKVVKPYVSQHKMNYRVLLGDDAVGQLYGGVDSLPTTFLIDRAGNIAYPHVGLPGKNEYLDEIQTLLNTNRQTMVRQSVRVVPSAILLGTTN